MLSRLLISRFSLPVDCDVAGLKQGPTFCETEDTFFPVDREVQKSLESELGDLPAEVGKIRQTKRGVAKEEGDAMLKVKLSPNPQDKHQALAATLLCQAMTPFSRCSDYESGLASNAQYSLIGQSPCAGTRWGSL